MNERFCPYCQQFKPDVGFKTIIHPSTGSKRGQCQSCQSMRKKPRLDLVALAARDKAERKQKK